MTELTPREHELYKLAEKGLCAKLIARSMGVSLNTIKDYAQRVRRKRGVALTGIRSKALTDRIESLECYIRSNGLEVPE